MRITLFGLAAIAILGAIVVFVGPLLISTDDLRDSLFAQVESATGYRLRVSGPIQVSLFPSLDLVAEDVGIAPGSEGDMAEMATARSLRFGLQLSALIGGKVKMTEVTLVDPVIAVPATKGAAETAKGEVPQVSSGSPAAALKSLSLDRLLIKNGTLILPGSGRGSGKRIEAFSLEASLPAPDATLTFEGSALVEGQKIQAAGSLGGLAHLDGEAVPFSLTVDAPSYLDERTVLNGIASYKGDSFVFSQFTARAGDKSLTGGGSYRGSILTLHPLTLNVGGNSLSGSVAADLSGAVPAVNAAFNGKTLNLDALLGKPASAAVPAGSDAAASVGWSDEKIDFSGFRSVTAKLKLSAGQLIYNNITISNATLQATVARGKLNATLARFQLYGGAGAAALDVDASGKITTQRIRLSLAKFDAYPFLKDSTGFQSIEGTGAISLDLTASGASQRAMVSGLNGAAKLEFTDGAIRGINIAKTMRGLTTGILAGWQENAAEKTDFATLGASFKIAKGQAQTVDLKLVGPLVRMAGAGTVDLPGKALKFCVDPQIVASLEGQGGNADLQGLGVPIVIAGPWDRPSIYPDIEGILRNPAAAYEQFNRLGGGLVSLPGIANTGSVSAIGGLIKNGKVGTDALPQGAFGGIGALLGGQKQSADEPQQTGAAAAPPNTKAKPKPVSDAAPMEAKKSKKRQAAAEPSRSPEDTARQLMQNFLGN